MSCYQAAMYDKQADMSLFDQVVMLWSCKLWHLEGMRCLSSTSRMSWQMSRSSFSTCTHRCNSSIVFIVIVYYGLL